MRVFLDTNFLISAFISDGFSKLVFECTTLKHQIVLSIIVINELERVLKIKLKYPTHIIKKIIALLTEFEITNVPSVVHNYDIIDSDDLWIIIFSYTS